MSMRKSWILAILGGIAMAIPANGTLMAQDSKEEAKAELERRKEEVDETDAEAMFALALWADGQGLKTDSKRILRKVIKVDKDHKEARTMLGYVWFEDRWVTKREKERLERKKEEAEKEAQGLKKWRGEWVPIEDYDMYQQGLVPVEAEGVRKWVTPEDKERIEKGMFLYNGEWITPEEKENYDKGMFKVGDQWVNKEEADQLHQDITNPWRLERDLVKLNTTCRRDFADDAMVHADRSVQRAYTLLDVPIPDDFVKIDLWMVKEQADYQQLGDGVQDNNDAVMSSTYATFTFQDPNSGRFAGVTAYGGLADADQAGNDNYSRLMLRHAAADTAVRNIGFNEQVPRWLQIGIGSYCGRFWDPVHADGVARLGAWSVGALQREGGLLKMKSFFDSFSVSKQAIPADGADRVLFESRAAAQEAGRAVEQCAESAGGRR